MPFCFYLIDNALSICLNAIFALNENISNWDFKEGKKPGAQLIKHSSHATFSPLLLCRHRILQIIYARLQINYGRAIFLFHCNIIL